MHARQRRRFTPGVWRDVDSPVALQDTVAFTLIDSKKQLKAAV